MREFKFRVWENVESKMNYDCIVGDNFIIFNYTGDCEDDLDIASYYLAEQMVLYYCMTEEKGASDDAEDESLH